MKNWPQRLAICVALAKFTCASVASAEEEFPGQVQGELGLTYQVPCSVCHIKGNTAGSTPIMPFALSLRARGLTDARSLSTALMQLEADQTDSDGDGATDIAELRAGTDPNSSANSSIIGDQEPGYGCGGSAPHGRSEMALGGLLGLGFLMIRRRKGHC